MPVQIQFRRDTAAAWTAANPTLAAGELGLETDTTYYKIGDGSTAWTSLAYGTIAGVLANNSITSAMIVDGAIVNADINASAAIDKTKISGTAITAADTGTVTSTMIVDGTIVAGDIASDAITTAKIADDSVTTAKIADDSVTQAKLADRAVGSAELTNLTVATAITDTYTLVLADAHKVIPLNKGTSFTVTVPPNSSVAFEIGDQVNLLQLGAGQVTVAAGAGVTIRSEGNKLKLKGQYAAGTCIKIDTDEWVLVGNLSA